jgi:hypothetical protein
MEKPPELHLNPEAAAEMAANAVLSYLNQLEMGKEERRRWIKKVFAVVESRADRVN